MKNKITTLSLTCFAFAAVMYAAAVAGSKNAPDTKTVEVSELGLNNVEMQNDKLNRLIKQYEFISPEATPWQTCQQ